MSPVGDKGRASLSARQGDARARGVGLPLCRWILSVARAGVLAFWRVRVVALSQYRVVALQRCDGATVRWCGGSHSQFFFPGAFDEREGFVVFAVSWAGPCRPRLWTPPTTAGPQRPTRPSRTPRPHVPTSSGTSAFPSLPGAETALNRMDCSQKDARRVSRHSPRTVTPLLLPGAGLDGARYAVAGMCFSSRIAVGLCRIHPMMSTVVNHRRTFHIAAYLRYRSRVDSASPTS